MRGGRVGQAEFSRILGQIADAVAAADRHPALDRELRGVAQALTRRRIELIKPSVQLEMPPAYIPGSNLSFGLQTRHVRDVSFAVHRIDLDTVRSLSLGGKNAAVPAFLETAMPLLSWTYPTGLDGELGLTRQHVRRTESLAPGAYALVARSADARDVTPVVRWFLVSKVQALVQKGMDRRLDIYAFDQETGALLPNVRGHIWRHNDSTAFSPTALGHAQGNAPRSVRGNSPVTIVGEADGQPFVIPTFYYYERPADDEWLVHLLADRPLYQPGETAQWKLTLRHRVAGELQVPAGARLKVVAKIRGEVALGGWDVTLNSLGSASGKLVLPPLTTPGAVSFEVEGEKENDVGARIQAFFVDHFRPPETTLTIALVDADQIRRARPGSDVELKVSARYFSGEPLVNGNISATVNFSRGFTAFHRMSDDDRYGTEHEGEFPERLELNLTTDAQGIATLRIPLPVDLAKNARVVIGARLASAGTMSNTSFGFELLPAGYRVEIAPASQRGPTPLSRIFMEEFRPPGTFYSAPQQPLDVAVFTRDGQEANVAVKGRLTIWRKTWEAIWRAPDGRLVTGDALRELQRAHSSWPPRDATSLNGWESIREEHRLESAATVDVVTDAAGRTVANIPPLVAGVYEIHFEPERATSDGKPLTVASLFVGDATTPYLGYHARRPRVIPCADEQEPGKPIRALVVLPLQGRSAIVRVQGAAATDTRVIHFEGDTRLVEFPWKPGYAAGARIDVAVLATGVTDLASEIFSISQVQHRTAVTVTPENAQARPGEKVRVRIRTANAAGQPVPSEIALTVAAVTSLVGPRSVSIADSLLRPARVDGPLTARTPVAAFYGRAKSAGASPVSGATDRDPESDEMVEDLVVLSPFSVSTAESMGYTAANTLAGSRGTPATNAVRVRSAFSYTAFWTSDVKTDRRGEATVEFTYPDNLTAWQVTAEAIGDGNRFGTGEASTRTSLPLLGRLRTPRVLIAGDTASLLGVVLNQTSVPVPIRGELTTSNASALEIEASPEQSATVPAAGEVALGWSARAKNVGITTLRFVALGDKINDAMELKLPVDEDGFFQSSGVTGRAAEQPLAVSLNLPVPLDPARTTVELQVSPGITPTLVQAMPYLIDYPYGCIEQTMSRFLPAAVVAKLLRDLGFDAAEIENAILPSALPAPPGRRPAAGLGKLDAIIAQSLARIQAAASNGEFGWFPGGGSDPYMTGYVLRGFNVAAAAKIDLPPELHQETYEATIRFLERNDPQHRPQILAWLLDAAIRFPEKPDAKQAEVLNRAFLQLYTERAALRSSGIALLAHAAHALERKSESAVLRRNLNDGVLRATSAEFGKTAHWGKTADYFDGLEGAVESTALSLQALLALDPKDELVDAAAAWLLLNRQSGRWNNTRDTALAVLALHDYARARGETKVGGGYRLTVNGRVLSEKRFERASLLTPVTLTTPIAGWSAGRNEIRLERTSGDTPAYLVATTRSWAQADSTAPAGSFLKVSREFARLEERNTVIGLPAIEPKLLPAKSATVLNRERVGCRLTLDVLHDLDYVIVESPKPGGCEPLNPLSGWDANLRRIDSNTESTEPTGPGGSPLYREEHDDRSVFFVPHLAAGRYEIRYTMRALFDGDYRALPATAAAIYVPVISANTEARRLIISPTLSR